MSDSERDLEQNAVPTTSIPDSLSVREQAIRQTIAKHFDEEISYKQTELNTIDDRIRSAKDLLDKLRVCIICKFYSNNGNSTSDEYKNHPAIREIKHEHIEAALNHYKHQTTNTENISRTNTPTTSTISGTSFFSSDPISQPAQFQFKNFDLKISVGNVSKYLNIKNKINTNIEHISEPQSAEISTTENETEPSQYNQDLITHKWMIYIRSDNCKRLESYIKKVVFYLHSSFKPYDVVEVKAPPFQLIKRGWGEFPIHVQIHFKDPRNKRVDIAHLLKLDWTQTGLQTFGGETTKDCQLLIKQNDFINQVPSNTQTPTTTKQSLSPLSTTISTSPTDFIDRSSELESPATLMPTWADIDNSLTSSTQFESTDSQSTISLLKPPSQQEDQAYPKLRQSISPSHFISANPPGTPSPASTKADPKASFDDLMLNFCSLNELSPEVRPTTPKRDTNASLDALLSIRPRSITALTPPQTPQNTKIIFPTIQPTSLLTNQSESTATKYMPVATNILKKPLSSSIVLMPGNNLSKFSKQQPPTPGINFNTSKQILNTMSFIKPVQNASTDSSKADKIFTAADNSSGTVNKRMVIYKVETSDALKTNDKSKSELLFKPINASYLNGASKLGLALANSTTVSKNSSTFKDTIRSHPQIHAPKTITTITPNITRPALITKVKSSVSTLNNQELKQNSNDPNLIERLTKKRKSTEQAAVTVDSAKKPALIEESVGLNKVNLVVDSNVEPSSQLLPLYSPEYLETLNVNLPTTFEACLKQSLRECPIVLAEYMPGLKQLYFCARSIQEFYSWPYAKRRAKEWLRALEIKNRCIKILSINKKSSVAIWSTKAIVIWLRSHGYTPLEYQHISQSGRGVNRKGESRNEHYVCSLTPVMQDCGFIHDSSGEVESDETEVVDVVGDIKVNRPVNVQPDLNCDDEAFSGSTSWQVEEGHLEMCEASRYIKEQLDLLNIRRRRVYLASSEDQSSVYSCDLVEKFLAVLFKRFAEDLIRQTCSDVYFEPVFNSATDKKFKKQSALVNTLDKQGGLRRNNSTMNLSESDNNNQSGEVTLQSQSFPEELGVLDIFKTIKKHNTYDFLTNKYMAVNAYDRETSAGDINKVETNSNNLKIPAGGKVARQASSLNNFNDINKGFLSDLAVNK